MGSLVVLVPAGGRGERFGAGQPKQFHSVSNRPVLRWTLERLLAIDPVWLTVALPVGVELPVGAWGLPAARLIRVDGGVTRQQSVAACLAATPGADDDLVVVHDGARPATAREDLVAVIAAARETGAAVLGRAMSDTVKCVEGARIVGTVDRRTLFRAETPQVFRRDVLTRAFAAAAREGREETDESAAVERLSDVDVRAVHARHANPKLTVPADLPQLAALLGDQA